MCGIWTCESCRVKSKSVSETCRNSAAKALLDAGRFDAAYYLAGYAIECALKACVCTRTRQYDFPQRKTDRFYQHNLNNLLAEVRSEVLLEDEAKGNPTLADYWNIVKDWSEEGRYHLRGSQAELAARALYQAISDPDHGVLKCLSKYW
jgi:hypothetical protein